MRGKAIIEKCREQVAVEAGKELTWVMLSTAIRATTGTYLRPDYLYNLYRLDNKPKEANRAVFAQFLGIAVTEISVYAPEKMSRAVVTLREKQRKQDEFNALAFWFITRPVVGGGGGYEV